MDNANKEEGEKEDTISLLVVELRPEHLQQSYQKAIEILKQAKLFEEEGKEELAKDAYFRAAESIKNLNRDFQWGVENKRLALERERIEFEKLAGIIPSSSTLDDLFSQVTSGLQGRMKGFYEGSERNTWNKKQEAERERHKQTYYLLDKNLTHNETADVIDKLRGMEWLTLEYYKDCPLSLEQRKDIKNFLSEQEESLESQLKTILLKQHNIPQEMLILHDLKLGIDFYEDSVASIIDTETFDIMGKKNVRTKLNFKDKPGSEIVKFGFNNICAFDPEIVWIIRPYNLLEVEQEKESYKLKVYNPKYKDRMNFGISSEPGLAKKADRRAKEIVEKLGEAVCQ